MNLSTTTVLFLAKPIISKVANEIFASIITEENLVSVRNQLVEAIQSITGKTSFVWDDKLVGSIMDKMEDPEFYQKWGDKMLDPIENWIEATETKWDDLLLMPVLKLVRSVCIIPDDD